MKKLFSLRRGVLVVVLIVSSWACSAQFTPCAAIPDTSSDYGSISEVRRQKMLGTGPGSHCCVNFIGYKFLWINSLTSYLQEMNLSYSSSKIKSGENVISYTTSINPKEGEVEIHYTLSDDERIKQLYITGHPEVLIIFFLYYWPTKATSKGKLNGLPKLSTAHYFDEVITFQSMTASTGKITIQRTSKS